MGAPELLIIFVILIIPAAVVFLILTTRASRRSGADPLAVLGERLARGEISPAEYDELRTRLE
ncbi:MAG: SHOCT domain-containing protein [Acidimicrobiia bacterium]|nr:SHOCT domain-containing protein [Acidimicrobiia bacterium]